MNLQRAVGSQGWRFADYTLYQYQRSFAKTLPRCGDERGFRGRRNIFARRQRAALWKVSLAMMMDGWMDEGCCEMKESDVFLKSLAGGVEECGDVFLFKAIAFVVANVLFIGSSMAVRFLSFVGPP